MDVPWPRRTGRGSGPVRRTGPAADHRREAGGKRFPTLLRTDEVDMRIDAAGCDDTAFSRNRFRAGTDLHAGRDVGHEVGISGMTDADDAAVLDTDIGLDDSGVVENERTRNHGVQLAAAARGSSGLPHPVTNGLAAAEDRFLSGDDPILFDLDDEVRVAESDTITDRGPVQRCVMFA